MNDVRFMVRLWSDCGAFEVVPVVDGDLLMDLVDRFELGAGMRPAGGAYGGLVPANFRFGPLDDHFSGRSSKAAGTKSVLLGCDCGEWGCWPLLARIVVGERFVTWDAFEQPHRADRDYTGFGPYRFVRRAYDAALASLCFEAARIEA